MPGITSAPRPVTIRKPIVSPAPSGALVERKPRDDQRLIRLGDAPALMEQQHREEDQRHDDAEREDQP